MNLLIFSSVNATHQGYYTPYGYVLGPAHVPLDYKPISLSCVTPIQTCPITTGQIFPSGSTCWCVDFNGIKSWGISK